MEGSSTGLVWGTVFALGRLHGLTVAEIRKAVPESTPFPQSLEDWENVERLLQAEADKKLTEKLRQRTEAWNHGE